MFGKSLSKKHCLRISAQMKNNTYMLGKKHKPSTIFQMSDIKKGNDYRSKEWKVKFPNGTIKSIKNLKKFCRDMNLKYMKFIKTNICDEFSILT